jgi:hypothetical protein
MLIGRIAPYPAGMKLRRQLALWGLLVVCLPGFGQKLPTLDNVTPEASLVSAIVLPSVTLEPVLIRPVAPCVRFIEPFDVDDYRGPLNGIVARFSQSFDSATPHLGGSSSKCKLTSGDKLRLFLSNNIDPGAYMSAAWDAGWAQLDYDDPSFGQGAAGFGKRYLGAVADNIQSDFFGIYLFPSIFHQDPRYFRLGEGSAKARTEHALVHRFVARSDSGRPMFNYSEWLGTASSKALGNLYHPGNPRGFGPTASRVGLSVGNGMAWDVVREFWPELAHKSAFLFALIRGFTSNF